MGHPELDLPIPGPEGTLDPDVEHRAGSIVCARALQDTSTHDEALVYAREVLEVLGVLPIPPDAPLGCGHARQNLVPKAGYLLCLACRRVEYRDRKAS